MLWSTPFTNDGASLTGEIVIVKVCTLDVSMPPLAVPPLSFRLTLQFVNPLAFAAGVKVRLPSTGFTAGRVANRALLSVKTMKVKDWPLSSARPGADSAGPAQVRLYSGIFQHSFIGTGRKTRSVIHPCQGDVHQGGRGRVNQAIGSTPANTYRPADIQRRMVGQVAQIRSLDLPG